MAYSLTAAQIAALTAERDQLQTTVNTYDSAGFITATNNGITAANEVDEATLRVWTSVVSSTDGTQPREDVLSQLDGLTPNRQVIFADMNDNEPLYNMGAIQPVIDQITDAATGGATALNVESSRRIRLTLNRYYPDVDDKDNNPASDTRNVFPDNPWFAYASANRNQKDYQDLNTLFQAGVFGNGGRGTPASITGNGPDPAGITPGAEAAGANTQIVVPSTTFFVGDNERFFIEMGIRLSSTLGPTTVAGIVNNVTNVSNISVRGTTVAGTASLSSANTQTGTTNPPTYSPTVGDILSLNAGPVQVVAVDSTSTMCSTTGNPPNEMTTCTTLSTIRYILLTGTDPSNGGFSSVTVLPVDSATKRTAYLALKRFTTAIPAGATNIATPAINTQAEVTAEITRVTDQLGTQTSLIYQAKYNISNTRCNWNNGTLSALISRENSRLNLFSPANLLAMGLIPTIVDFVNEYTRTVDKIAEIQAILDGAS